MEKPKTHFSDLIGNAVDYIETRIQIAKLDAADAGASAASSIFTWIILIIIGAIMLLFFSIGAALGIGYLFENPAFFINTPETNIFKIEPPIFPTCLGNFVAA